MPPTALIGLACAEQHRQDKPHLLPLLRHILVGKGRQLRLGGKRRSSRERASQHIPPAETGRLLCRVAALCLASRLRCGALLPWLLRCAKWCCCKFNTTYVIVSK
jgi:hypothetical protein